MEPTLVMKLASHAAKDYFEAKRLAQTAADETYLEAFEASRNATEARSAAIATFRTALLEGYERVEVEAFRHFCARNRVPEEMIEQALREREERTKAAELTIHPDVIAEYQPPKLAPRIAPRR